MNKNQILAIVLIILTIGGLYYIKNSPSEENAKKVETVEQEKNVIEEETKIKETEEQETETLSGLYVSDFNLEEILSKEMPVYLHFGAEWCGPCQEMKPYVEKIYKKYNEDMIIMYIDVDKVDTQNFPIQAVPTQFFFDSNGNPLSDKDIFNEISNFGTYEDRDKQHRLTSHVGLLTEEQLITIFKSLGLEVE